MTTRKIVVAVESNDNAAHLEQLLHAHGHHVRTAGDGLRALALTLAFGPDVIITSMNLPRLDAVDWLSRARVELEQRQVVLIILTGGLPGDAAIRLRAAGVPTSRAHFLRRPVADASILALLASS